MLVMYLGTLGASGYRVLLAGQETERDAYRLGQAPKVYGTLVASAAGEAGAGEVRPGGEKEHTIT